MSKSKVFLLSLSIMIITQSCVNHDIDNGISTRETDAMLFEEATQPGFMDYKQGQLLTPASASPHGSFRLRFNDIAWSSLDAQEALPKGKSFEPGAVIVKEIYNGNDLVLRAVIKKAPSDVSASNGWLWAEYNIDGSAAVSLSKRGGGCVSCHRESPNRDLTRTFDFH